MSGVDIILINALGWFLTIYCAGYALEAYQKQIREKLLAENRKIIDDIDVLLAAMKDS